MQITEGNPGALAVLAEATKLNFANIFLFGAWEVKGSNLWVKYKECDKDIKKLIALASGEIEKVSAKADS